MVGVVVGYMCQGVCMADLGACVAGGCAWG